MESEETDPIIKLAESQQEAQKKKEERSIKVAELISKNYQIGDAIVLDTIGGSRYFGFYLGITDYPQPMIMVAGCCVGFKGRWDEKWFNNINSVPTGEVSYFNAIPVKR